MIDEIERRPRKGSGNPTEYYIFIKTRNGGIIYNDWYTLKEIPEQIPECTVNWQALSQRIELIGTKYDDIWHAITFPARSRNSKRKYSAPVDVEYIRETSKRMFRLTNLDVSCLDYWRFAE